jgi:hypothetical protein
MEEWYSRNCLFVVIGTLIPATTPIELEFFHSSCYEKRRYTIAEYNCQELEGCDHLVSCLRSKDKIDFLADPKLKGLDQ